MATPYIAVAADQGKSASHDGSTDMDRKQAAMRGKIGGHVTAARYDSQELTRKAREAFRSKFELEVDPDGVLPGAERKRRAEHARKAHFSRLALKSAEARRKKKPRQKAALDRRADAEMDAR